MIRLLASLLACVLAAAAAGPAAAEPVPLSRFTTQAGPMRLQDASRAADLFVPIAATSTVEDAVLSLSYVNSASLMPGRSTLSVRLNEATLAQIPLDPVQPQGTARVRLPAELWRAGFNRLTLAVVQHYSDICEDPEAPELWTEVDLASSELDVTLAPLNRPYRISDLSGLFSPGLGGHGTVTMLTPEGDDPAVKNRALPFVAQALALRRDFAPLLVIEAAPLPLPAPTSPAEDLETDAERPAPLPSWRYAVPGLNAEGGVHVLAGTTADLAPLLAPGRLAGVDGPYLAVEGSGRYARLIVTGATAEDVVAAARDLGRIDDAINATDALTFRGVEGEPAPMPTPVRLEPENTYRFETLGLSTTTFNGIGSYEARLAMPLPMEFYTHESAQAELLLDFAYGAGLGPGSVMNITLNGEYLHGVLFDAPGGTAFRKYRIAIPARLLRRGDNELLFEVSLRPPLAEGECVTVKARYAMAQILGSSTFRMPPGGGAAVLPDFAMLAASGYPYVSRTNEPSVIHLGDDSLRSAALTLVGKIAQTSGLAAADWRIETGIPNHPAGRAVVLASTGDLNAELFGSWSAAVGSLDRWPYPALQAIRHSEGSDPATIGGQLLDLIGLARRAEAVTPPPAAALRQEGSLGELAVMTAFANPWSQTRQPLMILAAEDDATLTQRIESLVQPQIWGQLAGDLVVWGGGPAVSAYTVAQPFVAGDDDPWLILRLLLSNNPAWWLGGAALVILMIVVSATVLLKRRAARLAEEE